MASTTRIGELSMNIEIRAKAQLSNQALNSMYGLRKRIFKERLGWQVDDLDGYEYDDFDNLNPTYSLIRKSEKVVACARLLPTTGRYMLKNIFSDLARGEEIPSRRDVLEISRFAVDKHLSRRYKGLVSGITFEMFRALYLHAVENGVTGYVIVTTTSAERVMRLMKLPIRRFGDGKATSIDGVPSVALWLDVNPLYAKAVLN